jgi:hypothetical protein
MWAAGENLLVNSYKFPENTLSMPTCLRANVKEHLLEYPALKQSFKYQCNEL